MDRNRRAISRERVKLRRIGPEPKRSHIDCVHAMRPLSFEADTNELDVSTVHVFSEAERIALSFVTERGTINVLLAPGLAGKLGKGLRGLTVPGERPHARS